MEVGAIRGRHGASWARKPIGSGAARAGEVVVQHVRSSRVRGAGAGMRGARGLREHEGPEHGISSSGAGPSESMVSRSDVWLAENRVSVASRRCGCAALWPPHAASVLEGAQAIDPRSRTNAPSIERPDRLADETLIFRSFWNRLATARDGDRIN
jgi:hypothetical protein